MPLNQFTVAFLLTAIGLLLLLVLLYAFVKAVSYSTYASLEEEWKRRYRRQQSGKEGEETVANELAFLPREYKVLHRLFVTAPGRERGQEIDHVIIGPNGVFHLETKNDYGKIIITDEGDWIIKRGTRRAEGMKNPLSQIRRHQTVLREYLAEAFPGEDVPLYGAVVLARAETILEGAQRSPLPVLRADRLHEFITGMPATRRLSQQLIERIYFRLAGFAAGKN